MAEQEEDFSTLPLPDRFVHKVRRNNNHVVENSRLIPLNRIGKSESKATKMLRKLSKSRRTSQIQHSSRSCWTQACGKERLRIPT